MASARRVLDSALALAEDRLRLLSVELQQEKWRLVDLLLRAAAAVVLALLAVVAATATLIYLLWPLSPLGALLGVTIVYALAAIILLKGIQKRVKEGPRPFAGTISEFQRDRECLRPKS